MIVVYPDNTDRFFIFYKMVSRKNSIYLWGVFLEYILLLRFKMVENPPTDRGNSGICSVMVTDND